MRDYSFNLFTTVLFLYRSAGACTAAAFLKEFVTCKDWAHLDIAGVMENKDEIPYLGKGMSGKAVVEIWVKQICNVFHTYDLWSFVIAKSDCQLC